ncbi:minor tail protein [Gordonia phage Phishy]|nr:minor tail protein [Gordonia phage Phishy]
MSWSPAGPVAPTLDRLGWTPAGPAEPPPSGAGWWNVPQAALVDGAATSDAALIAQTSRVRDGAASSDSLYMGLDPANDFEVRIRVRDHALTHDRLAVVIDERTLESAAAADQLRLGVRAAGSAAAGDELLLAVDILARDDAALADLASALRARQRGRDAAAVGDAATAGFTSVAPVTSTFTAVGVAMYPIPVWSRYIDLVGLGGGAGGNGGGSFAGRGGRASSWASVTIERGVDIPWSVTSLSVVVGDGGVRGNAFGGTGGDGNPSYVQHSGADLMRSAGATAVGGTGVDRTGDGVSPDTLAFAGSTYTGGPPSTTDTASVPGSGGRGGGSFQAGTKGGRGQIWARARQ